MNPKKTASSETKTVSLRDISVSGVSFWSFFFFLVFGVQQLTAWPLIAKSGWRGDIAFADLQSVLRAADCTGRIGWDIYDPNKWENCEYIYGSLLIRAIRWLHLTPELTFGIGWLFIFLFSVLCGFVLSTLSPLSIFQRIACVLILVSPGSMLLLERGNFDVALIVLLAGAAISLRRGNIFLSLALISLSALFKFYTLPLIFLVLLKLKGRIRIALAIAASSLVALLVVQDLVLIKGTFPSNLMGSFGNQIPWLYLDYLGIRLPRLTGELIGFASLFLVGIGIWILLRKKLSLIVNTVDLQRRLSLSQAIQYLFICTFLICYFAGANYDYRIPYLMIPSVLFLSTLRGLDINTWLLLVPLLVVAWASFNAGWIQVFGDVAVLSLTATILLLGSLLSKRIVYLLKLQAGR